MSVYAMIPARYASTRLPGKPLLDETGKTKEGRSMIAVDAVGAGAGETVLILDEGNSARQVVDLEDAPIRAVIVGIVDEIEVT